MNFRSELEDNNDGSTAKNLPSGNSKKSEERFGHKVGEQETTSRKD